MRGKCNYFHFTDEEIKAHDRKEFALNSTCALNPWSIISGNCFQSTNFERCYITCIDTSALS